MSLFRSEDHVRRWTTANHRAPGEILSLDQVWLLAKLWYPDPRRGDWRPRTRNESQAVLAAAGLTGSFWELPR
jgi:hypothetical protein